MSFNIILDLFVVSPIINVANHLKELLRTNDGIANVENSNNFIDEDKRKIITAIDELIISRRNNDSNDKKTITLKNGEQFEITI